MRPRLVFALLMAVALLCTLHSAVVAQDVTTPMTSTNIPTIAPTGTLEPTATPAPAPTESTEVAILRAQLETMREYDQRLLATVYWALGALIAITLALITYSAFYSFVISEREKQAIREELEKQITRTLDQESEERLAKLRAKLAEIQIGVSTKVEQAVTSLGQQQIQASQKSHAEITIKVEKVEADFSGDIFTLKLDLLDFLASQNRDRRLYTVAIGDYVNLLEAIIKHERFEYFDLVFDNILKTLEEVENEGKAFDLGSFGRANIDVAISKLPSRYSTQYSSTIRKITHQLDKYALKHS